MDFSKYEAAYQAEVKQADVDHHKPTAGAMTGHIVANMWVMDVKLHQVMWFVKGATSITLREFYQELIAKNRRQLDDLGNLLLDENELPPATVAEYLEYAKLDEEPRIKFGSWQEMVEVTARDLVTANMFVDRAIRLAERESRPAMAAFLTTLRGENNATIRQLQSLLGKAAWEDLIEIDEDEDD